MGMETPVFESHSELFGQYPVSRLDRNLVHVGFANINVC